MRLFPRLPKGLRCTAPLATVFGVLLSTMDAPHAEQPAAPQTVSQPAAVPLGVKAAEMLKALDTTEGDVKAISILEINQVGETTLYEYFRFSNPSNKPLDVLRGVGSFADIPYLSVGGEQAEVEWGDYLPNKVERKFTARLKEPVPPGQWIEMILVGQRVAKYRARKVESGRWRLGPVTADVAGSSVSAVFAIRLPAGASRFEFQPEPDEVRRDGAPTAIWRKTLAESKDLKLFAEYER